MTCPFRCCRNPAHADVFVSCSGDNTVKVWDTRQPRSTLTIPAHQHEVRAGAAASLAGWFLNLWRLTSESCPLWSEVILHCTRKQSESKG